MQEIRRAGYILIAIMTVAFTCSFVWRPAPPAKFRGLPNVPYVFDSFQGHDVPVDAVTRGALVSAQIMSRDYRLPSGMIVNLTFIGGTNRSALHDPRSCLVGAGWKISDDHVETLPKDPAIRMRSCIADLDSPGGTSSVDMLYLYVSHGRVISSATEIRIALLEAALIDQSDSPVYFIRMTTQRMPDGDNTQEHAQMVDFTDKLWKQVRPEVLDGGRR